MQGEHCAPGAASDESVSDTEVVAAKHDAGNDICDCADRTGAPPTDPPSKTGDGKGSWRYFSHASCGDLKALAETYRINSLLETLPTDSVMQDCSALLMKLHSREGDLLDETHRGNATQELEKGQRFTLLKLRSALEFLPGESRKELVSQEFSDGSRGGFYEYNLSTKKDFVDRALFETDMSGQVDTKFQRMLREVADGVQSLTVDYEGGVDCPAKGKIPVATTAIVYKQAQYSFGS